MRKILLTFVTTLMTATMQASDIVATVKVVYDGTTATVTIPTSVSNYVTCESGTSSHVKIVQASTSDDNPGEIMYTLSGTSDDGEFYMTGEYKATVKLSSLTLTNPDSTAIHIKDGKRIKVSVTGTNSLTDGTGDEESKGCFHCKGHTEFVGSGTLNIVSNINHGIYSKEYVTIKNCTINITSTKKDGIHCQEYFLMNSGTVNISGVADDGIQVEIKDSENATGTTTDHEDEDSGNFYQEGGSLTISDYGDKAIKADGSIAFNSGTQNFTTSDITENAATAISSITVDSWQATDGVYDLGGRKMPESSQLPKGIYIIKKGNTTTKIIIK